MPNHSSRKNWNRYVSTLARVCDPTTGAVRQDLLTQARLPRASKYRNKATYVDGVRFASKLEADRYRELKALQAAGPVAWFIRQPSFDIPGGAYRADFLVVWMEALGEYKGWIDRVTVEDTKGVMTALAKHKIACVREKYGITVRILTRADVSRP
jgi:hypothetical protein